MSAAANGQPYDLDAAEAAIQAAAVPFVFTYKGTVYKIKNPALAPLNLQEQLAETEDPDEIARLMNDQLGEDVYTQLVAAGLSPAGLRKLISSAIDSAGLGDLPNTSPSAKRGSAARR